MSLNYRINTLTEIYLTFVSDSIEHIVKNDTIGDIL